MKYWQFGETMLEKLNRENHEQKQKENADNPGGVTRNPPVLPPILAEMRQKMH